MNESLLYVFSYKVLCLIAGSFSIYLGYKLFRAGFITSAGDMSAEKKDYKFTLQNAAPGTFFSVVGGFIICAVVIKGLSAQNPPVENSNIDSYIQDFSEQMKTLKATNDSLYNIISYTTIDSISADTILQRQIKMLQILYSQQNARIDLMQLQLLVTPANKKQPGSGASGSY